MIKELTKFYSSTFKTTLAMTITCGAFLSLQFALHPSPLVYNNHLWMQLGFYIVLILLLIGMGIMQNRIGILIKYQQLIYDTVFLVFFMTKLTCQVIVDSVDGPYCNMDAIFVYILLQGTLRIFIFKILCTLSLCVYLLVEISIRTNEYQWLPCIPIFSIFTLNYVILQYLQRNEHLVFQEQYDLIKEEYSQLKLIMQQINQGIIVYDQQFNKVYNNKYFDQLEIDNIENNSLSVNRTVTEHAKLQLRIKLVEQPIDPFIDQIKIKAYNIQSDSTSKYRGIRQVVNSIPQLDQYIFVATVNSINKIKYQVEFSQQIINDQLVYLLVFQPLDPLALAFITDDTKFRLNLINSFNHKLKTPLNTVISHLEQASRELSVNSELLNRYIMPSLRSSRLQLYLIQDIGEYVAIGSDLRSKSLTLKSYTLLSLINEIRDLIGIQCSQKSVAFFIVYNEQDISMVDERDLMRPLIADLNKLVRVLLNLLNNAYRFTSSGGWIMLEIQDESVNGLKHVTYIVRDSGVGMVQEMCAEIVRHVEFYQVNCETRKNSQEKQLYSKRSKQRYQLGISLKITSRLLSLIAKKGSFELESKIDEGTSFKFTIIEAELVSCGLVPMSSRRKVNKVDSFKMEDSPSFQDSQIEHEPSIAKLTTLTKTKSESFPLIKGNSFKSFHSSLQSSHLTKTKFQQGTLMRSFGTKNSRQNLQQYLHEDMGIFILVDDEPFNHISLEMMLKQMGYSNVRHCYNGCEVVELVPTLKRERVAAILMDIDMPVMNGIQACRILVDMMDQELIQNIPIVACTAHEDDETRELCSEAGMCQIVVKPIFPAVLQEALSNLN